MFLILKKRHILAVLAVCLLLVAVPFFRGRAVQTVAPAGAGGHDWGLSFQQEGKPPVIDTTADFLKQHNAYYIGDTSKKVLYLTFDAGYENGYTPAILDALKKHNVKAAFFVVGNYIKTSPDLVKRMLDEGHIVGDHTMTHPDMAGITDPEAFRGEIEGLASLYQETTGQPMQKFYRPPQGRYSESNLKLANEMGYRTIFWSLAYVDWYVDKQPSHADALDKLEKRTHPGAVVLLHSTSKTNSEILDELLTRWESMGYTFGTLNDLCGQAGTASQPAESQSSESQPTASQPAASTSAASQ